MNFVQKLLECFPSSELYRSYRSTSKKDKYTVLLEGLRGKLVKEGLFQMNTDLCIERYMSKPRVITQGVKSLDLRSGDIRFKSSFLCWFFEDDSFCDNITKNDDPVSNFLSSHGVSLKQLKQISKHKNRIPANELKQIQDLVAQIPSDGASRNILNIIETFKS